MATRRYIKPVRPMLNRADPFSRGLVFAAAPGWTKGFRAADGSTAPEEMQKTRGAITTPGGNFTVSDQGRAAQSGTVNSVLLYAAQTKINLTNDVSMAIVHRTKQIALGNINVCGTRQGVAAGKAGFGFIRSNADLKMRFRIDDGTNADTATGSAGSDVATDTTFLWTGTHDDAANTIQIYENGKFRNSGTSNRNPAVNGQGLAAFASTTNVGTEDAIIGLILVWNRVLRANEIVDLWTDPWRMFKPTSRFIPEFEFAKQRVSGDQQRFFLNF